MIQPGLSLMTQGGLCVLTWLVIAVAVAWLCQVAFPYFTSIIALFIQNSTLCHQHHCGYCYMNFYFVPDAYAKHSDNNYYTLSGYYISSQVGMIYIYCLI